MSEAQQVRAIQARGTNKMVIEFTYGVGGEEGRHIVPTGVKRSSAIETLPDDAVIINEFYEDEADNDKDKVPTASELTANLSAYRYAIETSGYEWNGWPVHSDDRAQFKALAEVLRIQNGQRVDTDTWKFADGEFRSLTNTEFIDMYSTGVAFVENCFACEALCKARIEAGATDIPTIWGEEWNNV